VVAPTSQRHDIGQSHIEELMTKKPGDTNAEPPGGRAAERLKMFEEARKPARNSNGDTTPKQAPTPKKRTPRTKKR
jgi:hypothetical protein